MCTNSMLERIHAKSHTHAISVRKTTTDKTREDRVIARECQRKKIERRKSWWRDVLKL